MPRIKIDHGKCTGCRHCEAVCSLKHYETEINPKKSRVRVFIDGEIFFPVIAGPPAEAECTAKYNVIMHGEEYDDCSLCRASCPTRPWFREPDTDIALKCDFCGDPPDPQCVHVCASDALTLIDD
jgi:Fe-S-cluster-containing hydrogenase component 2